ncbi:MAG: YceI family protein [candidate division KSB1 bacterium]|nr:YceI family protein [candidate division KSB1 bacterium]
MILDLLRHDQVMRTVPEDIAASSCEQSITNMLGGTMRFNNFLITLALSFGATTGFAQPEKYEIDPVHSNIGFTVRHMVIAKVSGGFKKFSGTILYDEKDITKSSVNVTINATSIDTDNERRDNHLRSADFLNAAEDSVITFISKKIEKRGDGYVAIGDLTIRKVTKQIELPFKILGKIEDSRSKRIGIEAGLTIDRFDYDVKWDRTLETGGLVVSREVDVNLTIEAIARKGQ